MNYKELEKRYWLIKKPDWETVEALFYLAVIIAMFFVAGVIVGRIFP